MPEIDEVTQKSTRDAILDAAERVVEAGGARRLTMDAVVKESGFSKGGVLYYFGSKQALVQGMIVRVVEMIQGEFEQADHDAQAQGEDVLPALVKVSLDHSRKSPRVSMALLAGVAEYPELIEPVRVAVHAIRQKVLNHARDPIMVMIAHLVADGLHFSDILGLDVLTPEERAEVSARLLAMISETSK